MIAMKLRNDRRGFVLSGTALLLVLPAMLLAASLFSIVKIGGETTSLQSLSDKVSYTGHDIERIIDYMTNNKIPTDGAALTELTENYRAATGLLVDIGLHPLWIEINTGAKHYAGTKYCQVEQVEAGKWRYKFEELDEELGEEVDWDFDEPILLVERLDGKIRITVEKHDGVYTSNVYYSDDCLWEGVGSYIGDSKEVDETLQPSINNVSQLNNVIIYVRDPRSAARYSSLVQLG